MNGAPLRGVFFCLNHDPKLPRLSRWLFFAFMPKVNGDLRGLPIKANLIGPAAETCNLSTVVHLHGKFCSGYLDF